LATTAFPFILLWYLNRDSVKKAFGLVDASLVHRAAYHSHPADSTSFAG